MDSGQFDSTSHLHRTGQVQWFSQGCPERSTPIGLQLPGLRWGPRHQGVAIAHSSLYAFTVQVRVTRTGRDR
jgi:hypothetical protein